jgi:hypothetical protein
VSVAGGNMIDGPWFETWSRHFIQGVVGYCNSTVWQVGSFGGLAESLVRNSMLFGGLQTPWMEFRWFFIVSFDGYSSSALARTR